MKLISILLLVATAATAVSAGTVDYTLLSTQPQTGDVTFYNMDGKGDTEGACSFSDNFAATNNLPWTKGVAVTIALNDAQFASGAACGLCVRFRGTGTGLGTTPLSSAWTRGFVNNRCPECAPGDLDLNAGGDGRWKVEWVATPCDVGGSKLQFDVVASNPFWASLVISNTAVPVAAVQVKMDGAWQDVPRAFNNQWAVHGDWEKALPLAIRATSVLGETVEDEVTGRLTKGTVQFEAEGDVKTGAGAPVPGWGTAPAGRSFPA